jgi:hypothetical protein
MSGERRFSEREIREVFERAAAEQERAARHASDDGLTVAEIQEVAASAGIAPEFVAAAARSVALGEPEVGRLAFGPVPRGVFRTEVLPGPPTDALWADLVADCRRTFRAQGKVTEAGRVREWRNGNLRVTLEPAGGGARLHLRTRRDDVVQLAGMGGVALVVGLFAAFGSTLNAGFDPSGLETWLMMALVGALVTALVWVRQRSWAATREGQFEAVARRAAAAAHADAAQALDATASPAAPRLDLDALTEPEDERATTEARRRARS